MEAARSSEMFVSYHITTQHHNPEEHDLNLHHCKNLMSHISFQNPIPCKFLVYFMMLCQLQLLYCLTWLWMMNLGQSFI